MRSETIRCLSKTGKGPLEIFTGWVGGRTKNGKVLALMPEVSSGPPPPHETIQWRPPMDLGTSIAALDVVAQQVGDGRHAEVTVGEYEVLATNGNKLLTRHVKAAEGDRFSIPAPMIRLAKRMIRAKEEHTIHAAREDKNGGDWRRLDISTDDKKIVLLARTEVPFPTDHAKLPRESETTAILTPDMTELLVKELAATKPRPREKGVVFFHLDGHLGLILNPKDEGYWGKQKERTHICRMDASEAEFVLGFDAFALLSVLRPMQRWDAWVTMHIHRTQVYLNAGMDGWQAWIAQTILDYSSADEIKQNILRKPWKKI